ncbi:hypothetical protein FH966_07835 [Lentibacillus cibarius]|uniref:SCP domain-containing protein n=1 Tax=Lentibacillus cibarius TaxID=2583219 RepID=A0A549YIA3_9BACI|nr:CAP domain-containing protein [Lentibacillus cibarius]TRM11611.1 hypothetical protein FH966_07835 [Lentibacillus cibarius]
MYNKLIVGSMTAALLFGGAFQTAASASTSDSQNESYQQKVYYSINGDSRTGLSSDRFTNYLNKHFPQVSWNQDGQKESNDHEDKDQPKQDKSEQQQAPSDEQTTNKQEQPKEQPEAQTPAEQQPVEQQKQQASSQSQQLNEFEQQVVELTNKERTARGLEPLKVDAELSKVAREKSRDMATSNYFSHNSPNYGSPFDMMKQFGISYSTAGENIAKGQRTPQQVVEAWMNSEGHRKNILKPEFTHIGVGYVEQGNHWTQQFIGK